MIMIAWNCQGLGQPETVRALSELIRKHSPSVIFLSETKQRKHRVDQVRVNFNFPFGYVVDPVGLSGGLSLWWSSDIKLEILSASKNIIDTVISDEFGQNNCRVSWFYGPPKREDKNLFWEAILDLDTNDSTPWMCVGDFNELIWPHEKEGGRSWNFNQRRFLREFMDACNLVDLGFKGQRFTWANNWDEEGFIQQRIDRGVSNVSWMLKWPKTTIFHSTTIGSDHCPLVIDLDPLDYKGPKPFKFELCWVQDHQCTKVVEAAWATPFGGSNTRQWMKKLEVCRNRLKIWSRNCFGNNKLKIEKAVQRLEELQQINQTEEVRMEACVLKGEINSLWSKEEQFWKQRSRINWLRDGDANTRFFHLNTVQRRKRNRLQRLKNNSNVWLESEELIREDIESYFQQLFATSGNREWGGVLEAVPQVVLAEVNANLTRPIELSEIQQAAFQLGDLKAPGPDGFNGLFYHKVWE